jgi:hypothetical protein
MRLQWWRDMVENAPQGASPPAARGRGPLGALLRDGRARPTPLDALIEARRRDIDSDPFRPEDLRPYLEGTAGNLLWAGAKALGEPESHRPAAMQAGFAAGLASWLLALPELQGRGRGFAEPDPAAIQALAKAGLASLAEARRTRFVSGVPALRAASQAGPILGAARRDARGRDSGAPRPARGPQAPAPYRAHPPGPLVAVRPLPWAAARARSARRRPAQGTAPWRC